MRSDRLTGEISSLGMISMSINQLAVLKVLAVMLALGIIGSETRRSQLDSFQLFHLLFFGFGSLDEECGRNGNRER